MERPFVNRASSKMNSPRAEYAAQMTPPQRNHRSLQNSSSRKQDNTASSQHSNDNSINRVSLANQSSRSQASSKSKFDMVTLLEVSNHLTSRQKQLLVALHQNDMQYLVDMDIMQQKNAEAFNFHFSDFKITPLMLACAIGNKNIVKILLQSPIREKINDLDSQGYNCLYYAVYHNHISVVNLLKSVQNPPINYQKDGKETSCLHIAIMRGNNEIVDFLLKKTLDFVVGIEPKNPKDKAAFDAQQAALKRKTNVAIVWEKNVNIDEQREHEGFSAVFFAIRAENLAALSILKKEGANFNLECMSDSKQRMQPVQYAVYRGAYKVYKFIVEAIEGETQFQGQMSLTGSTLLHLSAFKGDVNICKDLLEHNLNPYAQNKGGETCMHIAIRRNHFDFVFAIVEWSVANNISCSQAEVENQAESHTPFMTAVLRENFEIANLLLKNNLATKGFVNREGHDVRQIVVDQNRQRALAFLENREIPRKVFGREQSVNILNIPAHPSIPNLAMAKGDYSSSHINKNDIFGNSYGLKMHQQSEASIRSTKARGLLPIPKDKNQQIYADKNFVAVDQSRLSPQSSSSALRGLNSPVKRPGQATKMHPMREMPKLDIISQHGQDDIEAVGVRDFIRQSQRQ